jgi:hypothetical protein
VNRVFVIQEREDFNVAPARAFGEVDYLVPLVRYRDGRLVPTRVDYASQLDTILENVAARLDAADLEKTWIIPNGDPVLMAAIPGMIAARTGVVRILRWDRVERIYVPFVIDVRKGRAAEAAF